MLADNGEAANGHDGAWGGLVSALQRHTVHGELAQLPKEDRHILSLAYLSGLTNREIAAMLNISVSTVSRRMTVALSKLEDSMRRAGVWFSALVLAGLAVYARWTSALRGTRWPGTVAMVAAGSVAAVAIGVVVAPPASTTTLASPPQTARSLPLVLQGELGTTPGSTTTDSVNTAPDIDRGKGNPTSASNQGSDSSSNFGCHGNPTGAPPNTPVGPRGMGPHRPPVNPPGAGGCGPHADFHS